MFKLYIFIVCVSICFYIVQCDLVEEEGADCVWDLPNVGEIKGKCVNPRQCLTSLADRDEKQPECFTKGHVTYICCTDCNLINDTSNVVVGPKSNVLWKDGRKFRDHCLENLIKLPNKCPGYYRGISRNLNQESRCHIYSIWGVGGPPPYGAEPQSINPYEALVGYGEDQETVKWLTSGTIVSDKYILTSGFGKANVGNLHPKIVAVGVKKTERNDNKWQKRPIKKVHVHPEYAGGDSRYHYLALLELETPISFTLDAFPACLADPDDKFDTSEATYTPFVDPNDSFIHFEDTRHTVYIGERTAEFCKDKFTSTESPVQAAFSKALPDGVDPATQTCYGQDDTCLTVLGSPVVVNSYLDSCMNTVVGVKVFGDTCGPSIYARVAVYIPWIESIVWP